MARKRGHHRSKRMTIPVAVVGGFLPLAAGVWARRGAAASIGPYILGSLSGYQPGVGWNAANMREGALPILAGFITHAVAARLGVNRALARAGVPFIRI